MDKVGYEHFKEYELIFNVSDMYTFTMYEFSIELIDYTPLPEAPPVPELAPFFLTALETVTVSYNVNSTEPNEPVSYMLPEAFDYNFDLFEIFFKQESWEPWAHRLEFDGVNMLTIHPANLSEVEMTTLTENANIDLNLAIVDSKGFESPPYTLTVTFEMVLPESEEEEEEETNPQGGPGFIPDWDKFYAD